MSTFRGITAQSAKAWDDLYAKTREFVWGNKPIGFLETFLPELKACLGPAPAILDAGTGEGRNLPALEELNGNLWACDASGHGLGKISGRSSRRRLCIQSQIEQLPFSPNVFDLVFVGDVIETLPDVRAALIEINRVLKQGGLLLCNIPGLDDGISHCQMVPLEASGATCLYRGTYYYQFIDQEDATQLLLESGFEILRKQRSEWRELPHPEFRDQEHQHCSQVFLCRKKG